VGPAPLNPDTSAALMDTVRKPGIRKPRGHLWIPARIYRAMHRSRTECRRRVGRSRARPRTARSTTPQAEPQGS